MLLDLWEHYRRYVLLAGAILFVGSSVWLYQADRGNGRSELPLETPAFAKAPLPNTKNAGKEEAAIPAEAPITKNTEPPAAPLYIDVKGQVKQPGMYRFDAGMRVADAITKAGGTLPEADLEQINLAQPLSDGSAIVVPTKGTIATTVPGQQAISPLASGVSPGSSTNQGGIESSINVNTASAEELTTLPGIGQARARAILQYRSDKGGFRTVDELKEIEGIGDKMFERIKDRIRIR
ncbi:hypothetical protein BRE01_61110 [Brevibacillus reuszeri]|uniref:Competence protein ComEA n=1 Tax=Brevibacillus reuszeri TaxID=54915 RepID=A0A0K9YZA2_9BACL|nr:helix-hairpin-helix domain-containing protein [Brevibacillus reuszeri]KNB74029.1 competence protein ComEA [Brevibacillus reuszeri]MED1859797.1 helix-hairpin-helix domain-containing protein [Brevibacillus reuszeri]GED72409.1 hypothetical protein BRE01_61110 [Brevibacillus reuszeri]